MLDTVQDMENKSLEELYLPNIDNDIVQLRISQDRVQRFPRIIINLILKEMIQTA